MVSAKNLLVCVAFSIQLLLEHQDAIAPEKNDLLNELLELLGEVPTVESFLGKSIYPFYLLSGLSVVVWLVGWLVGSLSFRS